MQITQQPTVALCMKTVQTNDTSTNDSADMATILQRRFKRYFFQIIFSVFSDMAMPRQPMLTWLFNLLRCNP